MKSQIGDYKSILTNKKTLVIFISCCLFILCFEYWAIKFGPKSAKPLFNITVSK